jgi:MipA family protein
MDMKRSAIRFGILAFLLVAWPALAEQAPDGPNAAHLDGEVGLGVFGKQAIVSGKSSETAVLPYVFAQYGSLFGRIDTFGVKTLPVGYGHLEISTRVMQDGVEPDNPAISGLRERKDSRPLGLSTFQVTPYGAFALIALHDFGESKGRIVDANWTGKIGLASWLTLYPQLGAEHLSSHYVDYYFGVASAEGGFVPYRPGSTTNPYLAIYTDTPLGENVSLTLSVRQKWLGQGIADSPFVTMDRRRNAFAAVIYRFK